MPKPPVHISSFLRAELQRITGHPALAGWENVHHTDVDFFTPKILAQEFSDWKAKGKAAEHDHYYFGKDVPYERPLGPLGEYVLQHVHLVPLTNPARLESWNLKWRLNAGRRTSDSALVYVDGGRYGYLLLTILWEPEAHTIIEMKTPATRQMMEGLASVAQTFIHQGTFDF